MEFSSALNLPFYLYPILVYLALYALVYFGPLMKWFASSGLKDETNELARRIEKEVQTEQEKRTAGHEGKKEGATESEEEEDSGSATAVSDESSSDSDEDRSGPARKEHLSRTLESSFSSELVNQALQQLRTKYPHGNFREFALERLPSYASYDERLTAARNMSGLFVLFGLLGTMIKLNTIVQQIGGAAGTEGEGTVFLDKMEGIMSNIGGAFLSSIYGLALTVFFLVLIGLIDRFMQRRFDRLDEVVQNDLIPGLAKLQLMKAPNLSIGDLIDETRSLLSGLNETVEGLTEGMQGSLSELSDQIEGMMQDFGSFQKQYAELNNLIVQLEEHSENIEEVTHAIKGAGRKLIDPISEMNRDLNHAIQAHMGAVEEAVEESAQNRDQLSADFKGLQQDVSRVLAEVKSLVRENLEQSDEHQQEMTERIEKQIQLVEKQSEKVESQLEATAEALEAANSQKLRRLIEDLDSEVRTASGKLSDSAVELRKASKGLKRKGRRPRSLFEWVHRTVDEQMNENSRS
jgi:hypothetical protein